MRTLPARIQAALSGWYGIEEAPAVDDFIEPTDEEREALVIRELGDAVEIALRLPRAAIAPSRSPSFDELCQVIEGVSHFLYVAERARRELPTTQLELELQAEVDKYVLLSHVVEVASELGEVVPLRALDDPRPLRFQPRRAARVRERLFDRVTYLHPPGTEPGDRYRMANNLAARFAGRLEATFARHGRFEQMQATLRRFYRAGQTEKIELASAA